MKSIPARFVLLALLFPLGSFAVASEKTIIAHRGASGHLPEHTLEAYAFAYAQGSHFIEPDLVLTRDGIPIALHDQSLEATTDVAERFPARRRPDGSFPPIDFTLDEIKQLRVRERVAPATGEPTFPDRWRNRHQAIHFRIPTLAEIIELVQGLNQTTGREVGIYPELKFPAWHREAGFEFERILLETLEEYGYTSREDPVIIQSFEAESLHRLRELGTKLRLVQLIGAARSYHAMTTEEGLDQIAEYADGIGPTVARIIDGSGRPVRDNFLVREAQARGLVVHPYTFRADQLPRFASTPEEFLERILFEAGADGIFADHPGLALQFLKNRLSE